MINFVRKVKNFFSFLVFALLLGGGLVAYSLYEENRHYESCKELGVKCPQGRMHKIVASFEKLMKGKVQEKISPQP